MNWTSATPVGLPRALFAASPKTEVAFSAPFWWSASPLDATLPSTLVCVANKGLREIVSPLDATLAKNRGVGAVMVNQESDKDSCPEEHRDEGSLPRVTSRKSRITKHEICSASLSTVDGQ